MKIRADFITNSSSTGYIVAIDEGQLENMQAFLQALNDDPDAANEGVRTYMISKNIDELNENVNGRPFDWASQPSGLEFKNMHEVTYKSCKEAIENGKVVMEIWVDYNVCEQFDDEYGYTILESLC